MSTWNADSILARLQGALERGMDDAGTVAVAAERQLLSVPGPAPAPRGQPPHRQAGTLQAAQGHYVEPVPGGANLHIRGVQGPSKAQAYASVVHRLRPWMRQGVDASWARILSAVSSALQAELH